MLEAIAACERICGRKLSWSYVPDNRIGDHIWWVSSVAKFQEHYPNWSYRYDLGGILDEIHSAVSRAA
jgi:CDP-paratose 2-epimerase